MIRSLKYFLLAGVSAGALAAHSLAAGTAAGQLPFYFESGGDSFRATGPDAQCVIAGNGAGLTLQAGAAAPATLRLEFGGTPATPVWSGVAEQAGKINHLVGNQPDQWRVNQSAFGAVRADNVYPGISAVFYGNARRLEYDLTVAPGAQPETIALHFAGADKISVASDGRLLLAVAGREISQPAPVIYQTVAGKRHAVSGGYRLRDAQTVAFSVGAYDHSQPLVIDPYLSYATYFGGNTTTTPVALTVDASGAVYLAGKTLSTVFTNHIPGGFQTNFQGGAVTGDGFVAKFDATGSNLVYFTYLGGNSDDGVEAIAVDAAGHVYAAGFTISPNFPTNNCFAPLTNKISGSIVAGLGTYLSDGFVAELGTGGTNLIFSGYLGGSQEDDITAIALDTNRNIAYLTGFTYSTNFPVSANAWQNHFKGYYVSPNNYFYANAFVAAIGTNYVSAIGGANSFYSSYLGGTNLDCGLGAAVDGAGNVYVTGYTSSTNFPTTNTLAGMSTLNNSTNSTPVFYAYPLDAFVAKFAPGCTNPVYSTFLGGTNSDAANFIAVDAAGDAFVTGWTVSTNFPNTVTNLIAGQSFITNNALAVYTTNSFLVMITNTLGHPPGIAHAAVFGGLASDVADGVALDAANNIYIVGSTTSTNFPVTGGIATPRGTNSGGNDVFVTAIKADWSGLLYSTYLGGSADDFGYAIAVDAAGNAYITGTTISSTILGATINFPVWSARQTSLYGTSDGFLAKIAPGTLSYPLTESLSKTNLTLTWSSLGYATPAMLVLESNTNLLTTNWLAVTGGIWVTNGNSYQFSFGYTNRAQLYSNKASFFRLHKADNF